ncbi:MAG: universal stress protein [Dehalococcoidia bacterium]
MYRPIILALDGSELAEEAIPHAAALARDFDTDVFVIRAVPLPRDYFDYDAFGAGRSYYDALLDTLLKDAELYVHTKVEALRRTGVRANGHFQFGDPATVILEAAEEHPEGAVVIATHGRSGVTRWALGSVADKVVRQSPIPVILIRASQPAPHARTEATSTTA